MQQFIFALITGLAAGGLYAMLSQGLIVGFKGSGVINFAQGAIAMYAAYTWSELRATGSIAFPWRDPLPTRSLNLPVRIHLGDAPLSTVPAFVIAVAMAALIGLLCHLLVFRPLRNAPALGKLVGSLGIMLYLQQVAVLNFGTTNRTEAGLLPKGVWSNFLGLGNRIGQGQIVMAAIAVASAVLLIVVYRFTRFGLTTRAADENEKGAVLVGLSPQLLAGINWVVSAVLAGAAGVLFVGFASLTPVNYTLFVVPALVAAVLGNLQSFGWGTAAALALGAFQAGVTDLATRDFWPSWLPRSAAAAIIPFVAVVAYLYFRGDKLPIRGSLAPIKQASAPVPSSRWRSPGVTFVLGLVGLLVLTGSWRIALTTSLVFAVFMLSLVVVVGYLGQISLVQLAMAGVAGFAVVRLSSDGTKSSQFQTVVVDGPGLPAPVAMALGVVVAVIVGVLIGLPALRIRGIQLAVVTITAAIAVQEFVFRNESIAGPGVNLNPVPRPSFFGLDVGVIDNETAAPDRWQFSLFVLIWLVVLMALVANLRRGATGQSFLAVRANERAAAAAGINVARTKLVGFAIGAAIAGVAGELMAYKFTSITSDNYELFLGLGLLAFAFLGGITVPSGAVVGGLMVGGGLVAARLDQWFSGVGEYVVLFGAIGLIATAIMNPEGIVLANARMYRMVEQRLRRRPPSAIPMAEPSPTAPTLATGGH